MSRWWPERVRLGLAPERVDVARLGRWRRGPARLRSMACSPRADAPAWLAALEAIDAALLGDFVSAHAHVSVVLSNHFVRYTVLPWSAELTRPAEVEQLARLRFEQIYGTAARGWTVRCADAGWGAPRLACAVDSALVSGLHEKCAALRLRLVSLQPLLMAAFNPVRGDVRGAGALALLEPGRVCIARFDRGGWRDVTARRVVDDPAHAIEQELATLGASEPRAPAAGAPPLDLLVVGEGTPWPELPAWRVRRLGASRAGTGQALALCGAL